MSSRQLANPGKPTYTVTRTVLVSTLHWGRSVVTLKSDPLMTQLGKNEEVGFGLAVEWLLEEDPNGSPTVSSLNIV